MQFSLHKVNICIKVINNNSSFLNVDHVRLFYSVNIMFKIQISMFVCVCVLVFTRCPCTYLLHENRSLCNNYI